MTSASTAARASGGAAQHMPHPAVMTRGTGMSRPGTPAARQARSMAMAPVVVRKVTMHFSVFSRIFLRFLRQAPHGLRRRVRLGFRIEPAPGEPDGPLVLRAQGTVEPGGAVGTGAGGDVKPLRELVGDLGRVLVPDVQRHDGRPLRRRKIPVHPYAGQVPHGLVKPPGQGLLMLPDGIRPGLLQKLQRGAQPRQAVAIEGAGLQPGGVLGRLGLGKALDSGAAHQQGPQLHPRAHAQSAGALRAHEPLVAGEAHHVDVVPLHGDGKHPGSLGGIQDE